MTTRVRPQRGLAAITPYSAGKSIEEVQRQYGLSDVVKLASNENSIGTAPKVLAALATAYGLNYYPDPRARALTRALAQHLAVAPDHVIAGNGADALIHALCLAYLDDGDEVITSCSSFPAYEISARVMRAEVVSTPSLSFGLDLRAMAGAIGERTKIIFLCNPNNPTGTIFSASELDAFLEQVPEHVLVVLDEAYFEYVNSPLYPDSLRYIRAGAQNIIVLRTFSKIYGIAGLRLGYGIGAPSLIEPLYVAGERFPVDRLAQVAGLAALEDGEFARCTAEAVWTQRMLLYGHFERLGLRYVESHANFVLVELGPQCAETIQGLLEQGVIIRPGAGYALPEFARITVGTPAENERLICALDAVLSRTPASNAV